jgi:predicted nuclease of restriction endonuclease-like (RecB) superfamily
MRGLIIQIEDYGVDKKMNEIQGFEKNDIMGKYQKTENILNDIQNIIDVSQKEVYRAVNFVLTQRNWLIGYRIAEEELEGENRAEYGANIINKLSKELSDKYGKGFTKSNLYSFYSFYKAYPEIFQTVSGKSSIRLSWSHYVILSKIFDIKARNWYEQEAVRESWSVRTLQRNVDSQYYYRVLKSYDDKPVRDEMKEITSVYQQDKLEFIKNPVVVEFLGLTPDISFNETKLEACIISNLQKFIMEMGKGYAFVARQQHIHTEKQDYYIDLVFYNYILKCFVLIDLKTSKITHQDVGQMDMYIRMYDELKKSSDDNPTLGIVLCSETDEDIARYSVLHGNEQLFASKYKLYLPSDDELRAEIESQKAIFYLQQKDNEYDKF